MKWQLVPETYQLRSFRSEVLTHFERQPISSSTCKRNLTASIMLIIRMKFHFVESMDV
ncbi:hypothetical protein CEV33_4203 [Brucella grignonensis]|uniref:Uncharacterized protein n=1 Tax=Brucella grignonensis TaxID=94627 RepID=A0A256FQG7_9HYPH|nr:hypothetical protein CEV33_4203 [Brucella grignonensis]